MGSIVKRGLKYMAIVRLGEYKYRPIKSTLPTKNLAKQFILDTEHKILNNKYQRTTAYPTLPELIHRYLKEVTPRKSYFVQQYENYCLKLFLREFKQSRLKVNLLTTQHLGVYRQEYLKTRKVSTWIRFLSIFKHLWKIASTEWGFQLKDIFAGLQKLKAEQPRFRRLTKKECKLLLYGNHTPLFMRQFIELALETGMRRGELLGIQQEHIQRNTLLIPKRKNGARNSLIPLSNRAMELLEQMDWPIKLHYEGIKSKWRRLCEKYQILDLHFHDLRHEALSRYLEQGVSIQDVQVLSGHRDINVLMGVYSNLKAAEIAPKLNHNHNYAE